MTDFNSNKDFDEMIAQKVLRFSVVSLLIGNLVTITFFHILTLTDSIVVALSWGPVVAFVMFKCAHHFGLVEVNDTAGSEDLSDQLSRQHVQSSLAVYGVFLVATVSALTIVAKIWIIFDSSTMVGIPLLCGLPALILVIAIPSLARKTVRLAIMDAAKVLFIAVLALTV